MILPSVNAVIEEIAQIIFSKSRAHESETIILLNCFLIQNFILSPKVTSGDLVLFDRLKFDPC